MFDPPARQDLQDHLGYERYVLERCVRMVESAYGLVSPAEVTINDAGQQQIHFEVVDNLGGGQAMEVVKDAAPLLFAAAFKLVDMIIEWVIVENSSSHSCPWKFHEKRNIINTNHGLMYPDYLGSDNQLRGTFTGIYNTLPEHRNAIVHGDWGENQNGELRFDFTTRFGKVHIQQIVPFQQVLDFAAFSALVASNLVDRSLQTPARLGTLRWISDLIQPLHNAARTNALKPNYSRVKRITTWNAATPVQVDLAGIRDRLLQGNPGTAPFFDLSVEAATPAGQRNRSIPDERIPAGNTLVLSADWNQFQTLLPQAPPAPAEAPSGGGPPPRWVDHRGRRTGLWIGAGIVIAVAMGIVIGRLSMRIF